MLAEFLERYASLRPISPGCLRNYAKHIRDFEHFVGCPVRLVDLRPQLVDSWLTNKLRAGRSPYYVVALRSSILALWSAAHQDGLAVAPHAVQIRRPDLLVRCWSAADVGLLIAAARKLKGRFPCNGCPRGPYVSTAIAGTWYTGLRRGDLHRVRHDQIRQDGSFELIQHKTGRRHIAHLPSQLLCSVREWSSPPGPLWPRPGCDEVLRALFHDLVQNVASGRQGFLRGCWRDIRRSAENSAERRYPGRGHELGGHERRTFEKYYKESVDVPEVAPDELGLS